MIAARFELKSRLGDDIFTEGTAWNGVNVFRRNKHINETIQKNIRVKMKNKEREERRGGKKKRETRLA